MAQFARPDADTSVGNWTASSGSDRYAMIDESSASDSDYITVTDDYSGSEQPCTLSLSSVTDPADHSSTSVVVRAWTDTDFTSASLDITLKDGSTTIKTESFTPTTSFTNHTMSLSTTQAGSISSSGYGNLTLIISTQDGGYSGGEVRVSQAYFTCPAASSGITVTPSAATADADGVNPTVSIGDPPVTASAITADADTSGPNVVVTGVGSQTTTFRILDANGKTYDEGGALSSSPNDGSIRDSVSGTDLFLPSSDANRIGLSLVTNSGTGNVEPLFKEVSWYRFTNIDLLKSSTVESASLKLTHAVMSGGLLDRTDDVSVGFKVYGNDVDNASSPTSVADYNSKTVTTAGSTYTYSSSLSDGDIVSIDVKDIVQEIINRSGWSSGNALMLLVKDNFPNDEYPKYETSPGMPPEDLTGWNTFFWAYERAGNAGYGSVEAKLTVVYNNSVPVTPASPATAIASGENPTTEVQIGPTRAAANTVLNGIGLGGFTGTADANVAGPTVTTSIPYSAAGPATAGVGTSTQFLGIKILITDKATSKADTPSSFGFGIGALKVTAATDVVFNGIGVTPAAATTDANVVAPTVGTKESPADTKADTAGPTVSFGSITLTLTAATIKATTVTPVTVKFDVVPVTAEASGVDPVVHFSSVTITPSAATAEADVSSASDDLADIALIVAPATADADGTNPTTILGGYVITPTAATASTQSVTFSGIAFSSFVVSAKTDVNTLSLSSGIGASSITVTASAATADASSTLADVEIYITPSTATADINVAGPTVSFGSTTITPSAATSDAGTSSSFGIISFASDVATTKANTAGPTVVFSADPVVPSSATTEGSTSVGQVILGGYAVTPTASTSEAGIISPSTILSSFSMTPSASTGKANIAGPVVDIRTLITPSPATTDADVYNPQLTPAKITVVASTFFPRLLTKVSRIPEFASPTISSEDFIVPLGNNDNFTEPFISEEYLE